MQPAEEETPLLELPAPEEFMPIELAPEQTQEPPLLPEEAQALPDLTWQGSPANSTFTLLPSLDVPAALPEVNPPELVADAEEMPPGRLPPPPRQISPSAYAPSAFSTSERETEFNPVKNFELPETEEGEVAPMPLWEEKVALENDFLLPSKEHRRLPEIAFLEHAALDDLPDVNVGDVEEEYALTGEEHEETSSPMAEVASLLSQVAKGIKELVDRTVPKPVAAPSPQYIRLE